MDGWMDRNLPSQLSQTSACIPGQVMLKHLNSTLGLQQTIFCSTDSWLTH